MDYGGYKPGPLLSLLDYYIIHKLVQCIIAEEYGFAIEVYVYLEPIVINKKVYKGGGFWICMIQIQIHFMKLNIILMQTKCVQKSK